MHFFSILSLGLQLISTNQFFRSMNLTIGWKIFSMAIFCHNISVGDLFTEINLTNSLLCQFHCSISLWIRRRNTSKFFSHRIPFDQPIMSPAGFSKAWKKKVFPHLVFFFWSVFDNFFSGVGFITYQLGKVFRANNDLIGTFLNLGIQKKVELSNIICE